MSDPRTLIVVPAHNEEATLPATLSELGAALPGIDVVVVDDGSSDATARVATEAGVCVMPLPFNLGVGGAVRAGLRYAVERRYDRVVVVDADGQHDPASVGGLLAALDDGAAMAIGSRFSGDGTRFAVSGPRRRAMRLLSTLVRWKTGLRLTDTTSGFRAFAAPVVELLAREYPVEYLADTVEVIIIVSATGHRVVEVPVRMRPRASGVPSTRRLRLVINYLRLLIGIAASFTRRRPVRETP